MAPHAAAVISPPASHVPTGAQDWPFLPVGLIQWAVNQTRVPGGSVAGKCTSTRVRERAE